MQVRRFNVTVVALATIAFTLIGLGSKAQAPYTITDLGTLGGKASWAYSVNDSGIVVGNSLVASGLQHAFKWQNGVMTDLGTYNGSSNDPCSTANGINANGDIVGWTSPISSDVFWGGTGVVWYANGTTTYLTGNGARTTANKINDVGQVVGNTGSSYFLQTNAFLWYNDNFTYLPTLGGTYAQAFSLNNYGVVVGRADTTTGTDASYWDATGVHDMGMGNSSQLWAIMKSESVLFPVGDYLDGGTSSHGYNGFDIGTLGGDYSSLGGVNDYGDAVGRSNYTTGGPNSAILSTYYGASLYDLNTMIPSNSRWNLTQAMEISDSGQIVGGGTHNGNTHAFLLTPNFHLKSLKVAPSIVAGGLTATGTVVLDRPAPFDLLVLLGGSPGAIPESCIIPAEETQQDFSIDTTAVSSAQTVAITATLYGVSKSASLTIRPIGVKSLSLGHSSITGGLTVKGTVTLEAPADPAAITVSLSSNNSSLATPAMNSISLIRGKSTGTFTINTSAVTANTVVTITAQANGMAKSAKLTLTP